MRVLRGTKNTHAFSLWSSTKIYLLFYINFTFGISRSRHHHSHSFARSSNYECDLRCAVYEWDSTNHKKNLACFTLSTASFSLPLSMYMLYNVHWPIAHLSLLCAALCVWFFFRFDVIVLQNGFIVTISAFSIDSQQPANDDTQKSPATKKNGVMVVMDFRIR